MPPGPFSSMARWHNLVVNLGLAWGPTLIGLIRMAGRKSVEAIKLLLQYWFMNLCINCWGWDPLECMIVWIRGSWTNTHYLYARMCTDEHIVYLGIDSSVLESSHIGRSAGTSALSIRLLPPDYGNKQTNDSPSLCLAWLGWTARAFSFWLALEAIQMRWFLVDLCTFSRPLPICWPAVVLQVLFVCSFVRSFAQDRRR